MGDQSWPLTVLDRDFRSILGSPASKLCCGPENRQVEEAALFRQDFITLYSYSDLHKNLERQSNAIFVIFAEPNSDNASKSTYIHK